MPPDRSLPWAIAYEGVLFIAEFEQGPDGGVALEAYKCDAGIWTIGWGETDEDKAYPGTTCTKEQADRWLCDDISMRARKVLALCKIRPGMYELAAMVSLTYNIGVAAFATSSVLKAHNRGDALAAARAFDLWNKAKHPVTKVLRELNGLTRRRKGEGAMYLKDSPQTRAGSMPQEVAAESKLSASPLVQLGAAVAGSGGVVTTSSLTGDAPVAAVPAAPPAAVEQVVQTAQQVGDVASAVSSATGAARGAVHAVASLFGVAPMTLVGVAILALGAGVVYWRWKQRRGGWT